MKNHLIFKFLAIIFSALALLSTVAGVVGVVAFFDIGLYSSTLENVQDKQMSNDMQALAERIAMYYNTKKTECTEAFLENYFEDYDRENEIRQPQEGMWYYVLIDYNTAQTVEIGPGSQDTTAGAILYKEYQLMPKYPVIVDILDKSEVPLVPGLEPQLPEDGVPSDGQEQYPDGSYTYEWYNETSYTNETYILRDVEGPIYKIQLYLLPGAYEQEVAFLWELLDIAYEYKYVPVVLMVMGLLLLGVCVTFLCSTAGKKPGRDTVKPAALNCLPLDLYLAAAVLLAIWLGNQYVKWARDLFARETARIIALCIFLSAYVACLLIVGVVFATAAQLQMEDGYWWRRSAIYNLFRLLRRATRSVVRLAGVCSASLKRVWRLFLDVLPISWQWIAWAAVMVASVVLAVLSRNWWVIGAVAVFVCASCFYMLHAYKILLDGAKRMSRGDLDTPVDKDQLMGGFSEFATHLNALADVAVVAAQKQMRSERMRAELITNVSHDIKTPLTSIINYVDLLKKAPDPETAQTYLEVLSRQSSRMKKLIDDLIELSKASTGNMLVDIQTADAVEYLNQAIGEFSDKLDSVPLTPIFEAPEQPVMMRCDSRLTWRVLSNLLSNAVKYALPGTRLYIDVVALEDRVLISLKNISRQQLNVSSEELMERFVRGDASRNTEGSGLGLNIAKSLMELQKGQLHLLVDGDLFKATMVFPKAEP